MTVSSMNVVMPISASVIPSAVSTGRIDGPGRWISSPAGGGVGLERAHDT